MQSKKSAGFSIEMFNPLVEGEAIPYLQANRHVVQNISNAECLGVWVYLLTLPRDWKVIKEHVQKHFHIGQDKLKRIFAYLKRVRLLEYVQERRADGTVGTTKIIVLNGSKFNDGTNDLSTEITAGVKTTPPENHTCGNQLLHIKQNTNKIINKKSFCESEQKNPKSIAKREHWKEANSKKPPWTEGNKVSPFADMTKQSTWYVKGGRDSAPNPSSLLTDHIKKQQNRKISNNETTELSSRTEVQPEVAPERNPSPQSADNDAGRAKPNPPPVRGSDRLLEARRACSYLEALGMASDDTGGNLVFSSG